MIAYLRLICVFALSLLTSCNSRNDVEAVLSSDDFIKWDKNTDVSWDMFEDEGNGISPFIGLYFIYDFDEKGELKFNVTTYFDKEKSRRLPMEEIEKDKSMYDKYLKIMNLKFDYFEIGSRKFRRYLSQNRPLLNRDSVESMRALAIKHYDERQASWKAIHAKFEVDVNREDIEDLEYIINLDLEELKEFDKSLNNYP